MDRRQFLRNALIAFTGAAIPLQVIDRFLSAETTSAAGWQAAGNIATKVGLDVAVHGHDATALMTVVQSDGRIYIKDYRFVPAQGEPDTITYRERIIDG